MSEEILIPKGTRVFSTNPKWPRDGKVSTRRQRVQPHRVQYGRTTWAGGGGYWHWIEPPS